MSDLVWQAALAEIDHLPPAAQAYRLGELYGWQHAKPTIGSRECSRMDDARLRVEQIVETLGEWVYDLFGDAVAAVSGYNHIAGILRFDRAEWEAWRESEGGAR